MDECPSRRVPDGFVSRRGSGPALKDTANNRDQDARYCNRIGCSGRLNSINSTRNSCSEKLKTPLQSLRTSSSGKEIVGSSSKTYYAVRGPKKSAAETQKKLSSQLETDSSETSSIQDEPEISQVISSNERVQTGIQVGFRNSDSTDVTMIEAGSSSVASNIRGRRDFNRRPGMRNKDTPTGSSALAAAKSPSQTTHAGAGRHTLRNLRCNSISDVIPSGCSSSEPNLSKRKDVAKKRNSEAESSSTRGKKISGSSSERRINNSGHGIYISDSRGAKNITSLRENGVPSGRSRTSINGMSRARGHSNRPDRNSMSLHETRAMISHLPEGHQPDSSSDNNADEVSTNLISSHPISYRRSDSNIENIHSNRPASPAEVGLARTLATRDSFRRYGIAEVLLALERIEHDEELTYEQVILLETNLFLGGLNFYDQHRDMRLDIDNMSYEELLALEERMGTVSTALTEEALSQCLNRTAYQSTHPNDALAGCNEHEDGVKCCICQEEYSNGDEVGMLRCEHTYHAGCIQQWLRLKNWCPICKASVEAPASSSSSSSLVPLPS